MQDDTTDKLEHLAQQYLKDQRRGRRWSAVWRGAIAAYFGFFLVVFAWPLSESMASRMGPHAGVVRLSGVIAAENGVSADMVMKALAKAYEAPKLDALFLEINSPGGSPVQAERITGAIQRLKEKHPDVPVIAIIEETGASAAYYIASAADEIVAARASIVGSIGVRLDSFGLTGLIEQVGIERRLFTAGENKGALDMFSPVSESVAGHIDQMLEELHAQFIGVVREGRGTRLTDDEQLFSGLFWTGEHSVELGLVDRIGDRSTELEALGLETAVDYTPSDLMQSLSKGLGASAARFVAGLSGTPAGGVVSF